MQYVSEDGASDYLSLLAWRQEPYAQVEQRGDVPYAQVEQRGDVDLGRWPGYSMEALGSGAPLPSMLMMTSW